MKWCGRAPAYRCIYLDEGEAEPCELHAQEGRKTTVVCHGCGTRYAYMGLSYCCTSCVLSEGHSKRCENHAPRVQPGREPTSRPAAELLREGHRKSHPHCRWDGPHYVPPSMGEPGFFLCDAGTPEPPPSSPARETST